MDRARTLDSGGGVLRDLLCEFARCRAGECQKAQTGRVRASEELIDERDKRGALAGSGAGEDASVLARVVGKDLLLLDRRLELRNRFSSLRSHLMGGRGIFHEVSQPVRGG